MDILSSRILLCPGDPDRSHRFYRDVLAWPSAGSSAARMIPGVVFFPGSGLLEVSGHAAGPARCSVTIWIQVRDVRGDQLDRIRDPAALPGWLATTTRRQCLRVLARGPRAAGYEMDAEAVPDEQAGPAEEELLAAERHGALLDSFRDLPPCDQRLIPLLLGDPPLPYAAISARLSMPIGSIGPTRRRCLDKLRRHPAIAALINTDSGAA